MAEVIEVQEEEKLFGVNWYDPTCYATAISDANNEKVKLMRSSTRLIT